MKIFKKALKYTIAGILILFNVFVVTTVIGKIRAERALEKKTQIGPEGISSLEQVEIGGVNQWIFIRGQKKDNPVVLYVHGGPGSPHMFMARSIDAEMERDFVVVNWDQRSAGKSFSFFVPTESLNKEQYLKDTYELVQLLKKRFHTPKIYIMGHSWGSYLSAVTAHRHPEDFIAYIGIGQMVNAVENEQVSYDFVLKEARRENNADALRDLESIGRPPYKELQAMGKERTWLGYYGGAMFYGEHRKDAYSYMGEFMIASPEYTLVDNLRFFAGVVRTLVSVWPEFFTLDLYKEAPSIDVPVYFMTGRHDYNTPWEIVLKYEKVLKAPRKTVIWFEESAHAPNFEEPEAFAAAMRRIKKETYRP